MLRLIFILIITFYSMIATGQSEKFDKIVESLFFNVNVSSMSATLIDSFQLIKKLTYEPPKFGTRGSIGPTNYHHKFKFSSNELIKHKIDSEQIDLDLEIYNTDKFLSSLFWTCSFENLVDAKSVFDELKLIFDSTNAAKKVYHFDSTQFAEYIEKTSSKYPHIYLSLFEIPARDKTYKIILFWDKKMKFEK